MEKPEKGKKMKNNSWCHKILKKMGRKVFVPSDILSRYANAAVTLQGIDDIMRHDVVGNDWKVASINYLLARYKKNPIPIN